MTSFGPSSGTAVIARTTLNYPLIRTRIADLGLDETLFTDLIGVSSRSLGDDPGRTTGPIPTPRPLSTTPWSGCTKAAQGPRYGVDHVFHMGDHETTSGGMRSSVIVSRWDSMIET
jgi:hypothetical protein